MQDTIFDNQYYQMWALLHQTRHVIHEAVNKEMVPLGVSTRQAAALLVIEANKEAVTPAQISRWLGRDSASVTVLLNRMQRKELINKDRNPNQKNSVIITLTEKGKQACTLLKDVEVIRNIFSKLSNEQQQQLKECLEVLWRTGFEILGNAKQHFPRA